MSVSVVASPRNHRYRQTRFSWRLSVTVGSPSRNHSNMNAEPRKPMARGAFLYRANSDHMHAAYKANLEAGNLQFYKICRAGIQCRMALL